MCRPNHAAAGHAALAFAVESLPSRTSPSVKPRANGTSACWHRSLSFHLTSFARTQVRRASAGSVCLPECNDRMARLADMSAGTRADPAGLQEPLATNSRVPSRVPELPTFNLANGENSSKYPGVSVFPTSRFHRRLKRLSSAVSLHPRSDAGNGFGIRNIVVLEDGFPITQPGWSLPHRSHRSPRLLRCRGLFAPLLGDGVATAQARSHERTTDDGRRMTYAITWDDRHESLLSNLLGRAHVGCVGRRGGSRRKAPSVILALRSMMRLR
jgi:hypothetical protein